MKLNGTSPPVKRSRSLLRRRVGTEYASRNWWRPDSIARVNPKNLQLFVDGQEQAIRVVGQDDSRFDSQDFIEFYATGLDTPFTDTRTYYLLEGESSGKRITTSEGRGEEPVSGSFPFSVTFKEKVYYLPEIINGDADNFFGPALAPEDPEFPGFLDVFIGASNLDPSPSLNATIEIALQGYTAELHRVKILLNDNEVGTWNFSDRTGRFSKSRSPSRFSEKERTR